jgi:hypothetical protein
LLVQAVRVKCALFHSPLVGPATWWWVARSLEAAGHDVVVPDLRDAAVAGDPHGMIAAAAAAIPREWSTPVLVGHSGFGSLLPSVASQLGGRSPRALFVDAGLPPCEGSATASADFLDRLRSLAVDGVLPKWSTWWGEGVMQTLVPAVDRRVELEAEMPEVPLAFFESPIDVPWGWCETRGSFLLLSEAYRDDAERARALEWPTLERLGGHLDIANDPDPIARLLVELAS